MTDEKDNNVDNVIYGPWGSEPVSNKYDKSTSNWIKQKYDRELDKNNSQLQMKEKLAKIDIITENIMVQMIHTMSENGYDITDEQFILDVGFLSEVIKGALSRQVGLPHIIQGFIEQIMSPERKETEDGIDLHYSRFDSPLLGDVIEMVSEIIESEEDEVEVEFHSDTELQDNQQIDIVQFDKLSDEEKEELRLLKEEDDEKETLHSKRNKDIIKDEDDE
jgi:hypothetical protein|tara:strand:+ start:725 stop:1384 length:660 start_codon:yes stop_codon:yes gene_type:complete